jgi:dipeptidase E
VPRILLLSSSNVYGRGYLDHAEKQIGAVLGDLDGSVAFLPFALFDRESYARKAAERFAEIGYRLESVHRSDNSRSTRDRIASAAAFFVGGGNTFRLLDELHRRDLIGAIRERVAKGVPYIGSSAGSIVAGPTLKTTKDMPIVQPRSFDALGLVDFQISPHFLDPDPASTHMGESQEERILQYLEENDRPVAGLREAAMLRVEKTGSSTSVRLEGSAGCRIFRKGLPPVEARPVAEIGPLLGAGPAA